LFDKKPRVLGNNIDVILLTTEAGKRTQKERLSHPEDYVACGELKGGIDPAGADEHWKTAASALERVRKKFKKRPPALFFVGAAIEESMAREIFDQLGDGRLTYAANLTVPDQLRNLASWLVTL
jgi:type II restriction enzyme